MGRPAKQSSTALGQRLVDVRISLGFDERKAFADTIGVVAKTLGDYEKGVSQPVAGVLEQFRLAHGVDLNWLTTGEGRMFTDRLSVVSKNNFHVPDTFSHIPRYDVRASAGDGAIVLSEEPIGQIAMDNTWLAEIGLDPMQAGVVISDGTSMEPTILDSQPLIVDFSEQPLVSGKTYVINLSGEVMVKRLQRNVDGSIDIISDNPVFPIQKVAEARSDQLVVVGRVRYIIKNL